MSIISWMVSTAWLCVLVTSLTAAIEIYDEMPPGDMSLMYQEHNYIDPGPQSSASEPKDEGVMRNLLLYKMLTSLRNQAVSPNVLAGPKWMSPGTGLVPPETFDDSLLKGSILKRISAGGLVPKARGIAKQPIQKWKIKKGKVGSQMICYFKLCAFRPPM